MKDIKEVRKICGHYFHKPEYNKVLGEHRCHHSAKGRCPEEFSSCPLHVLIKRVKVSLPAINNIKN